MARRRSKAAGSIVFRGTAARDFMDALAKPAEPEPDDGKRPMWLECKLCQHRWIGVYLPMEMLDFARIMKNMSCPKCAAEAKDIVAVDNTVAGVL